MNRCLFRKFANYIRKVFRFEDFLTELTDLRRKPLIAAATVVLGVIYGTVLRIRAVAEIERECREGFLKKRVGPFSDDTAGYALDRLDSQSLRNGWHQLARIMKRNGMIRDGRFGSLIVGVLDGIETLSSYYRHCDRCQERQVTVKEKGVEKKVTQYYHRFVVLCLIGHAFPIPLELEPMQPGEGEVECALRLLTRVRRALGARFLDAVAADALYCTPAFFAGCSALGLECVSILKGNQAEFLREALMQKEQAAPSQRVETATESILLWDLPEVDWATADQNMRVILAERTVKNPPRRRPGQKEKYAPKAFNAFVFSPGLRAVPAGKAFDIGRHRWDIDASLFQDMTQNWFLKHPTVHFPTAYENMLILRLIAYFLAMFFTCRHINARRKTPLLYSYLATLLYQDAVIDNTFQFPLRL